VGVVEPEVVVKLEVVPLAAAVVAGVDEDADTNDDNLDAAVPAQLVIQREPARTTTRLLRRP